MAISNMSLYFGENYYQDLILSSTAKEKDKDNKAKIVVQRNKMIRDTVFCCPDKAAVFPGERNFSLWTTYPGLMAGIGYYHDAGLNGNISAGFSFDYVTGLPYLPGSSVKGVLRAAFSHPDYIRELIGDDTADISAMEFAIFGERQKQREQAPPDGKVIFLDAFPAGSCDRTEVPDEKGKWRYQLLELDNITPHHQDKTMGLLTEPNPLTFLKVRPGVEFFFRFLMPDVIPFGNGGSLSADVVSDLFQQILLDLGAGAKTNVGFGSVTDERPQMHKPVQAEGSTPIFSAGKCRKCGEPTGINKSTGRHYDYCSKCNPQNGNTGKAQNKNMQNKNTQSRNAQNRNTRNRKGRT